MSVSEFKGTERFELISRLGAGGMGVVYRALDRQRGAEIALKTLHRLDPASILRLKQEFRTIAHVVHPNLVTLHELVHEGDLWFITMDLLRGVSFLDWVRQGLGGPPNTDHAETVNDQRLPSIHEAPTVAEVSKLTEHPSPKTSDCHHGRLDVPRLRDALRQLVHGVMGLHAAGMMHRDLKPGNVMVQSGGKVMLLDFGLVTQVLTEDDRRPWQTQSEFGLSGTIEYMAPEQSESGPPIPASDYYAVGVMLFQALTGRLPYGGSPLKVLMEKRRFDAPSPSDLVHGLPADLVELCNQLMRRDHTTRPTGPDVLAALDAISSARTPFTQSTTQMPVIALLVGREAELQALRGSWDEAVAGRGRAVYVHGSSGMGKSALIRRFLAGLPRDALVLAGRCYERESVPYKALDLVIDELTTWLTSLPADQCLPLLPEDILALARLFPVLRQIDSVINRPPLPEIPDVRELRRRAIDALRELLRRIGLGRPVVLYIDDLQWGDKDSAFLLADVLRPPDAPPFLLLGGYRTEEASTSEFLPTFREHLLERAGALPVRILEVGPLGRDDTVRLARSSLGASFAPAEGENQGDAELEAMAVAIAAESHGNPFLVEALVDYVQSGAAGVPGAERARAANGLTLAEMMQTRMLALSEDAQRLLTVVCIAGRPLARAVAKEAAQIGSGLPNALAILRAQHLVRVRVVGQNELLESYHDRIRETVTRALSAEVRMQEHLCVGVALESAGQADVESLAEHFYLAGHLRRAGQYTATAARHAAEALAFDQAAVLFRRALDLSLRSGTGADNDLDGSDAETPPALRLNLAEALVNAGRCQEAAAVYLAAAVEANAVEALDLKRLAGEQLLISGHLDEGKAVLESVLEAIDMRLPATPKRALVSLLAWRGRLRLRGLGFKPREAATVSATDLSRIDLTWAVALGLGLVDHIRAADYQARSLYHSLESGERFRIARSLSLEVAYAASVGKSGEGRVARLRKVADTLVPEVNAPHTTGIYAYSNGVVGFSWGRWAEARGHFEKAERTFREHTTGLNWEVTSNHLFLLSSLGMLGEIGEIARRVPPLLDDALSRGNVYAATSLRTGYPCLTWLARDEPEVARDMVRHAMSDWSLSSSRDDTKASHGDSFHLQHYFDLVAQTHIDLYSGRAEDAWRRMVAFWPGFEASLWQRVEIVRIDTLAHRARTAVALLATDAPKAQRAAARETAEKDARKLEKEDASWAWPNAWQTQAALKHLAGGDVKTTLALLERAETGYAQVDMALHAASVRRRRGELSGGEAGARLAAEAEAAIFKCGAQQPEAIVEMLAPGFSLRR